MEMTGLPFIEVYQIGDVYFVLDGNHRVSVARQLGAKHIQANVTQVITKVAISPDIQPDELIVKAEYADFLEFSRLDILRPEADLSVTAPGQYHEINLQISFVRDYLSKERKKHISEEEAVVYWFDEFYLPVASAIRDRGLLREFPDRTVTDLYLWVYEHRTALEKALGWDIKPEEAASDLAERFSPGFLRKVSRIREKIFDKITPDELEAGPAPGEWRKKRVAARRENRLFTEILIPIDGTAQSWQAFEQALLMAQREGGRLRGLHVLPSDSEKNTERARVVQTEFLDRCEAAGIQGQMAIEIGGISRKICERARWARLSSGFRTMIQRCPRPVVAVPGEPSPMNRALLAFDGSPKAMEALFIGTYLNIQWATSLVLLTITEGRRVTPKTLDQAQQYLEAHGAQALALNRSGPEAGIILASAEEHECDMFIMGGYGMQPVQEVVLGSTVDQVLRESRMPVMVCR
jgi:nucleotide-binding universal stress UspA family protein